MQKKIIALAVAGLVSGAAFADGSSVTVYGIADVTFDTVSTSGGTAAGAKTGNYTRVSSNSSYLGFKGSEDLGNNLKAVFQFESGVTADAGGGASMFGNARDTYVGLAGGFGQVALGTLTAPTRLLGTQIDVNAGATGIGSNAALLSSKTQTAGTVGAVDFDSRQGNAIAYSTPNMSGFGATVAYVSGENKTKDSVVAKANASAWDLGATYNLTGMSYLPRQDNNDNGVVAQYEFYVSTDSSNWGTAVSSGTFKSDHTEKVVTFASKAARYIRFRALSEIQGKQYTGVAELNVIGTAQ